MGGNDNFKLSTGLLNEIYALYAVSLQKYEVNDWINQFLSIKKNRFVIEMPFCISIG